MQISIDHVFNLELPYASVVKWIKYTPNFIAQMLPTNHISSPQGGHC
jgi:hypothetical protein